MPIISNEDKEFLEYVAYKINTMLFASSPNEEPENKKIVDFAAYSKKVGYDIKTVKENISATSPPNADHSAALQLDKEKKVKGIEKPFTKKEVQDMPRLKDFKIRIKNEKYYEFRFRKYGYNMSFCSVDFEEARHRAFSWLATLEDQIKPQVHFTVLSRAESDYFNAGKKVLFKTFADDFMYNVKKKRVKPITFSSYCLNYKKHIVPIYGKMRLIDIKPFFIQKHLDQINKKTPRASEDVKTLLNNIFEYAVVNGILDRNPVKAVYLPKHDRKIGSALTKEQEKAFIAAIKGTRCESYFLKMLYSGVRPSEVYEISEDVEKNTLTIKNSKLKSYQKNLYRVIPIFPKYQTTLDKPITERVSLEQLRLEFKKFLPDNTLKDLRHTFTTRARECGIDNEIVAVWTGHSLGNITASVYTHFSYEFQQEQAKKLDYSL